MKNGTFQKGNISFETAGIKFSAVFSDALPRLESSLKIIVAEESPVRISADGKVFELNENEILVLPPKAEAKAEDGKAAFFAVAAEKSEKEFAEDLFSMFSDFFGAVEATVLENGYIPSLARKGLRLANENAVGVSSRLEAITAEITFELYDTLSAITVNLFNDDEKNLAARTKNAQIRKLFIDRYLRESLRTDVTLDAFAKKVGVSSRQLNRIFSKNYGMTFYKYLTHLRIEEAKRLLSKKPTPAVEEVAYAVGYSTYTGFHNAFKKETGLLPGEYRRRKG